MTDDGRARLFVALDLPDEIRAVLAGWAAEELSGRTELRPVRPESLHVTLAFLGSRAEDEAASVREVVAETAAPVPGLALGAAAWLPPRRARVLVVDVEDRLGALTGIQAAVSAGLASRLAFEPEARPFRPHVTVARVRRGARIRNEPPTPPPAREFAGEAVALYRSTPDAGGSRYDVQSRVQV